ncbi:MAG TPA: GyrI-like domain-containing protein [Gaiellaceae bacterium]|nr:GyrI-like domain-containing protein [Gaiellaceae bacterium]
MIEIVTPPRVETRLEIPTFGIREVTPYRGLLKRADELLREARASGIEPVGFGYLRLYVVDMSGDMEIESGFVVDPAEANGSFPAGDYAALTYRGTGIPATKALFAWVDEQGVELDRKGDTFACRYERFLTDPKVEPRKKQRDIEVAMKVAATVG